MRPSGTSVHIRVAQCTHINTNTHTHTHTHTPGMSDIRIWSARAAAAVSVAQVDYCLFMRLDVLLRP
jgi:hypothetical protein